MIDKTSMVEALKSTADKMRATKEGRPAIQTGIEAFDNVTHGMRPGYLVVVAGESGIGKTALMTNIAANVARDHKVMIYSIEMTTEVLVERMLSKASGIPFGTISDAAVTHEQVPALKAAVRKLGGLHLDFADKYCNKLSDIKEHAAFLKENYGLDMIIIDHLQRMTADGYAIGQKRLEIKKITGDLQTLAKELDIVVILLSQFNREVQKRDSHRPKLSDLMESASIEQDADQVVFLYKSDDEDDDSCIRLLTAEKNRNGVGGATDKVFFHGRTQAFVDISLETRRLLDEEETARRKAEKKKKGEKQTKKKTQKKEPEPEPEPEPKQEQMSLIDDPTAEEIAEAREYLAARETSEYYAMREQYEC